MVIPDSGCGESMKVRYGRYWLMIIVRRSFLALGLDRKLGLAEIDLKLLSRLASIRLVKTRRPYSWRFGIFCMEVPP